MDHAGAMLVGGALIMLFSRMVLAVLRNRAMHQALTQHYTDAARAKKPWSLPGAELLQQVPLRLRIGLAMGAAGALVPFATRKLSGALVGDDDGPVGKALFIAGKWLVLGGILTTVRKWGVGAIMAQRRPAHQQGVASLKRTN